MKFINEYIVMSILLTTANVWAAPILEPERLIPSLIDAGGRPLDFAITPDSQYVVFILGDNTGVAYQQKMYQVKIDTKEITLLTDAFFFSSGIKFKIDGDGTYVYFLGSTTDDLEQFELYRVLLNGGAPEKISLPFDYEFETIRDFLLTTDGKYIVYATGTSRALADVPIYKLVRLAVEDLTPLVIVQNEQPMETLATPDNQHMIFGKFNEGLFSVPIGSGSLDLISNVVDPDTGYPDTGLLRGIAPDSSYVLFSERFSQPDFFPHVAPVRGTGTTPIETPSIPNSLPDRIFSQIDLKYPFSPDSNFFQLTLNYVLTTSQSRSRYLLNDRNGTLLRDSNYPFAFSPDSEYAFYARDDAQGPNLLGIEIMAYSLQSHTEKVIDAFTIDTLIIEPATIGWLVQLWVPENSWQPNERTVLALYDRGAQPSSPFYRFGGKIRTIKTDRDFTRTEVDERDRYDSMEQVNAFHQMSLSPDEKYYFDVRRGNAGFSTKHQLWTISIDGGFPLVLYEHLNDDEGFRPPPEVQYTPDSKNIVIHGIFGQGGISEDAPGDLFVTPSNPLASPEIPAASEKGLWLTVGFLCLLSAMVFVKRSPKNIE
jgi:hypothetical protein